MVYWYGPTDASYSPGGTIELINPTPGIELVGGTTYYLGGADAYFVTPGSGVGTELRVYRNGAYMGGGADVPLTSSVPWSNSGVLPGSGTANYGFTIWTEDSAYGVGIHGLYLGDTATPPPASEFCEYGYEKRDIAYKVARLDWGTLVSMIGARGAWAIPLLYGTIGQYIDVDTLCSGPPPPLLELTPLDFIEIATPFWNNPGKAKAAHNVRSLLWDRFCKCVDAPVGSPDPTKPDIWNVYQPTWYVTNVTNNINNWDLALTFNYIINFLGGGSEAQNITQALSTFPSRCAPDVYEEGIVHEDLVGSGRFPISEAVGFKIEVVERNVSELTLSGQPMYLWNMGWISTLAGELLLEEKRVTREGYLWFPCSMQHATEFTYTLRDYTRLKVTELRVPSAIVLMG